MRFVTAAATAPLLLVALLALPLSAEVPDRLASPNGRSTPIWLSLKEAMPEGKLRWELLEPTEQRILAGDLRAAREARKHFGGPRYEALSTEAADPPCSVEITTDGDYWPAVPSLGDLFGKSVVVYSGKILDQKQGLFRGRPATLIEVAVSKVLKAPPALRSMERVYVYYPYAKVPLDGEVLCGRPERGMDHPVIGGRLMVFSFLEPIPASGLAYPILAPMDVELFFEKQGKRLSLPRHYPKSENVEHAPTWEDLELELESQTGDLLPERNGG